MKEVFLPAGTVFPEKYLTSGSYVSLKENEAELVLSCQGKTLQDLLVLFQL